MTRPLLPCLSGKALCDYCGVDMEWHPSGLCAHDRDRCQCCSCFNPFKWEELRFWICPQCYPQTKWAYQLVKKETPACHKS